MVSEALLTRTSGLLYYTNTASHSTPFLIGASEGSKKIFYNGSIFSLANCFMLNLAQVYDCDIVVCML